MSRAAQKPATSSKANKPVPTNWKDRLDPVDYE